jgi:hypothetical protein
VSFFLVTGPGILILTIVACALVVGATMVAAILALAAVVATVHVVGRLRRL